MTPRSFNESDSGQKIVDSEFERTRHSKEDEVQSILKPPSETAENELELLELSRKEGGSLSHSNSDSAEATLEVVKEPSVIPLMENTRTSPPVNLDGQTQQQQEEGGVEDSGRERLKRHRVEVAGRVWIPDMWGQEELLKDWIDCSAFDASLMNSNIMLARAALVSGGRRANSSRLRIENSC